MKLKLTHRVSFQEALHYPEAVLTEEIASNMGYEFAKVVGPLMANPEIEKRPVQHRMFMNADGTPNVDQQEDTYYHKSLYVFTAEEVENLKFCFTTLAEANLTGPQHKALRRIAQLFI